ncbi:DUF2972 domain-containing protein [Helicobacter saguini]|uniref:DUF2972 domain-containing protein n=1 Tax=Helicobacter saguini TaxID=1548018 RepID=A0A347VPI8_9HELI|nr:DUF2972 domain-containing protein [Helicobacter saguini]MWV67990.1 DUF2972 domain-containing protein [Helicobacter saguini]MWV70541.1 DUF2972 domain-containing protein [Helicobacter saguini]MWV72445.1 DUF2972 domain-containing protein [Helicobacter saguini]TLD94796.1 DUF2972 domain-containing protein [Helicobacter saguini]
MKTHNIKEKFSDLNYQNIKNALMEFAFSKEFDFKDSIESNLEDSSVKNSKNANFEDSINLDSKSSKIYNNLNEKLESKGQDSKDSQKNTESNLEDYKDSNNTTDSKNTESKKAKNKKQLFKILDSIIYTIKILNPKNIESFLNSSDFKTDFIDKNHPYPPLIKPDSINYDRLPPQIAWLLNIPLPSNYELVLLTNGGSASDVSMYWLRLAGFAVNVFWTLEKEKYVLDYTLLLKEKNGEIKRKIALSFTPILSQKGAFLLAKNSKILYIARDPFSRYKVGVNHLEWGQIMENKKKNPLSTHFFLTSDYKNLFVDFAYYGFSGIVKKPEIATLSKEFVINAYILFTTMFNKLRDLGLVSELFVIDFNELMPHNAYNTMKKVGKHFNFTPLEEMPCYTDKRYGDLSPNLPVTLEAKSCDIPNIFASVGDKKLLDSIESNSLRGGRAGIDKIDSIDSNKNVDVSLPLNMTSYSKENISVKIHIGMFDHFRNAKDLIEISSELFSEKIIIDKTQIRFYISKFEINTLKNNPKLLESIKIYLKGYINALDSRIKDIQKYLIKEPQILAYLESNKLLCDEIKQKMDVELKYFIDNYPQIVKSWKYYNEFIKMCEK